MKNIRLHPTSVLAGLVLAAVVGITMGQTSIQAAHDPRPIKILGQPAASEWIDIESGTLGGPPTQFVVPPGQVLTLVYQHLRNSASGFASGSVEVDGSFVSVVGIQPSELRRLHNPTTPDPLPEGETAREGQVVTLALTGGSVGPTDTFIIRGWLEEAR